MLSDRIFDPAFETEVLPATGQASSASNSEYSVDDWDADVLSYTSPPPSPKPQIEEPATVIEVVESQVPIKMEDDVESIAERKKGTTAKSGGIETRSKKRKLVRTEMGPIDFALGPNFRLI